MVIFVHSSLLYFNSSSVWGFGDSSTIDVFPTKCGKIGAAICWENYMPLLRTHYYQQGLSIPLVTRILLNV